MGGFSPLPIHEAGGFFGYNRLMPRNTDINRILGFLAVFFILLTVGCVGTVFYQVSRSARSLERSMNLAIATGDNDLQTARRLLAEGADPNYEDCWTPLDMAVQNDNYEMVKLLLNHGAKPYHISQSGPVLFQAQSDAIFDLLLNHDADANARTLYEGREPILNAAVRDSQVSRVRAFLAHGADPYLKDDTGKSAFDLLPKTGIYSSEEEKEIVRLLHAASQKRRSP